MRRILLVLLVLLIALVTITAGVAWYAVNNEDFLKSRLRALVLQETGRELHIDGPVNVHLGRETSVQAEGIRFANAAWAKEPDMARIGRFTAVIDIPSLFSNKTVIPLLSVEDCALDLVENQGGSANWEMFPEEDKPASVDELPLLLDAKIRNCRLTHAAPTRAQPLIVEIAELSQGLGEDQRWRIEGAGSVAGEPFSTDGWLSPAKALVLGGPLEHELAIQIGKSSLKSAGTFQDVATGQGADIELHVQGPDFARILSFLDLPGVSEGVFDFRLSLNTEGQLTRLDINGDLGNLRVRAEGELDRLVRPSHGGVRGTLEGPDLAALGVALGIDGLASTAYALDADLGFEPGLVRFRLFELEMPIDRLALLGVLGTARGLAGTDLDIAVSSEELGRWAGAFGRPVRDVGAVTLSGRLLSDANGRGTIRARVEQPGSLLALDGALGSLAEPLQPDLNVDFHSNDPRKLASLFGDFALPEAPLDIRGGIAKPGELLVLKGVDVALGGHTAHLDGQINPVTPFGGSTVDLKVRSPDAAQLGAMFGREGLPVAPFTLAGRVSRPGERIRFDDVVLDLAGHRVSADGVLNPNESYAGSEFEVQLDSPDVAALALLFGREGLPQEPMKLSGVLKPEGKGLKFTTQQGSLGDIRLAVDGHIPNLDQPLALDADFDIGLPSLALLDFLAPQAKLPDLPFTAVGRMQSLKDRTQLQNLQLTLGDIAGGVVGDLYPDGRFDLRIEAGGPDATTLAQWLGQPLLPEPFSLRTRVSGNRSAFDLAEIEVSLGRSRVDGNLRIGLDTPNTVSGKLLSPYLDLSHRDTGKKKEEQAGAAKPASPYVFDDTRVMWIEDFGIDADVDLRVAELDLGNTRLRDIEIGFLLERNRVELDPFTWRGEQGGALRGHVVLDDSGARPVLDIKMTGKDLRLGLSAGPDQDPATLPSTELQLELHGSGVTRREMASNLDGKIRAFGGPGLVASAGVDLLFSDFLSELFDALNPVAETDEYTKLDCSVWAADIVAGSVAVGPMVARVENFTIFSKGTINLQTESIDLSFTTKPRKGLGITPGTVINTLIKVGGTLQKPAIELDPAGAIVSGGTAIATAGLSIVAKSFSDRFLSSKDPCGDARKELAKRDQ